MCLAILTAIIALGLANIVLVVTVAILATAEDATSTATTTMAPTMVPAAEVHNQYGLPHIAASDGPGSNILGGVVNPCEGKKALTSPAFDNIDCFDANDIVQAVEQAGADVTAGYQGSLPATQDPQTDPYWKSDMCPVNVHWHLGAEHRSAGEYDENGSGPSDYRRRLAAGGVREGHQCHHYDASDPKFTTPYDWQHCIGMEVGNTYEVHWPHSAAGACTTPHQYQYPFYDGVFCHFPFDDATAAAATLAVLSKAVGVQAQVFTIVNDESYYYPDLMRGMIKDGNFGSDVAIYTGSTTGTSRNNEICSKYGPITWQVDRKCHLISASTFDKMCADMKAQSDDMLGDLYAHGARETVSNELAANNQQDAPAGGVRQRKLL